MTTLYSGSKGVKFLTGAPPRSDVSETNSVTALLPAFRRFLGEPEQLSNNPFSTPESDFIPKWRLVPKNAHSDAAPGSSFFSISHESDDRRADDFVRHSYRTFVQSKNENEDGDIDEIDTIQDVSDIDFSFETATDMSLSFQVDNSIPCELPSKITEIKDLPSVQTFNNLPIQDRMVHLLVGVISKATPREVVTRKSKRKIKIVELLVGDNTKAGFNIAFWLHPSDLPGPDNSMKAIVEHIRAKDLVLLKNVGLSHFQEQVHGQSLSKAAWRSKTEIHILGRDGNIQANIVGPKQVQEQATQVQNWIKKFLVGTRIDNDLADSLPPDTLKSNSF